MRNAVGVSVVYVILKVVEPVPDVYPVKEAVATTLYIPLGAENVTMYLNVALPLALVVWEGSDWAGLPFG